MLTLDQVDRLEYAIQNCTTNDLPTLLTRYLPTVFAELRLCITTIENMAEKFLQEGENALPGIDSPSPGGVPQGGHAPGVEGGVSVPVAKGDTGNDAPGRKRHSIRKGVPVQRKPRGTDGAAERYQEIMGTRTSEPELGGEVLPEEGGADRPDGPGGIEPAENSLNESGGT